MSSIVISGDTSGAITLAAPAVSGTNTATLPAATGTVMVSGNMPAFSAYANAQQAISGNTYTKVLFQIKEFDTANCFASSTFTPNVAGYYQINSQIEWATGINNRLIIVVYKNGIRFKRGNDFQPTLGYGLNVSALVYCNGTTDYLEIYVYQGTAGTINTDYSVDTTYFQAVLVRTA